MYTVVFALTPGGSGDGWASAVEERVRRLLRVVVQRDDLLTRRESVEEALLDDGPVVTIVLGEAAAKSDASVAHAVAVSLAEAIPILPLFRTGDRVHDVFPSLLTRLNALCWDGEEDQASLAVLDLLGLNEDERKLFLSYRRIDTEPLAQQLRTALSERRYDVFLDRFSVPPAADFQRRLDIELADKAFVLLLESRTALGSPWVQHEVSYALGHLIGLLALTMPDTQPDAQFPAIDEAFRRRLTTAHLDGAGTLTAESLHTVLSEVETMAARLVRRRRAQLVGSTNDWLFQAGFASVALGEWGIAAERNNEHRAFFVTARAPTAGDLRAADALRKRAWSDGSGEGVVVHSAPVVDPARVELIDWVVEGRPLRTAALEEIPSLLGLP